MDFDSLSAIDENLKVFHRDPTTNMPCDPKILCGVSKFLFGLEYLQSYIVHNMENRHKTGI